MDFNQIRDLIKKDLEYATGMIYHHLDSAVPLIKEIGHYIIESGGKRSRAILALLSAKTLGLDLEIAGLFAAIIEMIHAATLLHDDVVDASAMRRGKPSANMIYSNSASVLSGDFLYSRTFEMMVLLDDMNVLRALAAASNKIAEGEMLQLQNCHRSDLTEARYLEVIEYKTATLFAVASKIPAVLAKASQAEQKALYEYGRLIGIAFQLTDDVLDYAGHSSRMGKNPGDDLTEGKMTLPLIYAKRDAPHDGMKLIDAAITEGDASRFPAILDLIKTTGSIEKVFDRAREFVTLAKTELLSLPDNEYTKALSAFADLAVARQA